MQPDFDLSDVDRMATEVAAAADLGLGAVVDAMPCDAGRNVVEAGRAVAPDRRPRRRARPGSTTTATTGRRTGGIACRSTRSPSCSSPTSSDGIDANDYADPSSAGRRTGPASSRSPARRRSVGRATGRSSRRRPSRTVRTGVPILTHCEGGTGALEQVRLLRGPRRRPGAHRAEPRRQGRRPRATTGSSRRPAPSPSTTGRSAGGTTSPTARSSSSTGRPRTAGWTTSSWAWTPRDRATTRCTVDARA